MVITCIIHIAQQLNQPQLDISDLLANANSTEVRIGLIDARMPRTRSKSRRKPLESSD